MVTPLPVRHNHLADRPHGCDVDSSLEPIDWYAVWYRLDETDRYLLWWSEGVFVTANQRVPVFQSLHRLRTFAERQGIAPRDADPRPFDLDQITHWLARPEPATIDCPTFLNAWNLFDNIALGVDSAFPPDEVDWLDAYHRLFHGSNLPAITPPGEHFTPTWDCDDVAVIAIVLTNGLALMRDRVFLQTVRPTDGNHTPVRTRRREKKRNATYHECSICRGQHPFARRMHGIYTDRYRVQPSASAFEELVEYERRMEKHSANLRDWERRIRTRHDDSL